MPSRRFLVPLLLALAAAPAAAAPAADRFDVQIYYRIDAFPRERVPQYFAMLRYLERIGFQRDTEQEVPANEPENRNATMLKGTVPLAAAPKLLQERHVRAILLSPTGSKPQEVKENVRVDLRLTATGSPALQRRLAAATRKALDALQFREAIGYDHRGSTRLLGSIPGTRLETLLTGVEVNAGGRQALPRRTSHPLRIITAWKTDAMPLPASDVAPPDIPKGQEKYSPDLRTLVADAARAGKATRLEVILAETPSADSAWQRPLLNAIPDLVLEGRIGPLVTVYGPARTVAAALAAVPEVAGVRLPRPAQSSNRTAGQKIEAARPLRTDSPARLPALGHGGRGTRLAVVDSDFRGWQTLLADKKLPAGTKLIDLTRSRNADLLADPMPGDVKQMGSGCQAALAVLRAAPSIQLTLLRIDPAAPYMLEIVARAINGDEIHSLTLNHRLHDLEYEKGVLDDRQDKLLEERRQVFADQREEGAALKARQAYEKAQAAFDKDLKDYRQRLSRYLDIQRELASLRGIRVVTSSLVWNEGYPVDGGSTLSRYFDDRPFRGALWFQAAGDTRHQVWSGPFRDEDSNGVMEFASPQTLLAEGSWTHELNFLGWQPATGAAVRDLPAGARVRVALQWREAHDALPLQAGEDPYRTPLADLRLLILHQLDSTGKKQPADDLEIVAQSVGPGQRLSQSLNAATYEQTVELVVAKAGRYTLRIEGQPPESTQPRDEPVLPAARKRSELRLRLFVDTLSGPGRAVVRDHVSRVGAMGMPGDSRQVVTVGGANAEGRVESYSAEGPPYNEELLSKPNVLAADQGEGTSVAAAYVAGLAAMRKAGIPQMHGGIPSLLFRPGEVLGVPRRPRK
jgi:hypothetical protein